jgi:hypothetical protein
VVGERVVVDAVVDLGVGVSGALCTELPYCPVIAVLRVEKLDERVERIAVGALRVRAAWAGRCNDCRPGGSAICCARGNMVGLRTVFRDVAEVKTSLWVSGPRARYDLA